MTSPRLPQELDDALRQLPDGDALRAVWRDLPTPPAEVDPAARDAAWARLSARLADPARPLSPDDDTPVIPLRHSVSGAAVPPVSRRSGSARWLRRAAALFGVAVLGGATAWRIVPTTVRAPAGGAPQVIALADGSTLTLAPGSAVTVSRALGAPRWLRPAVRTVTLDGEAFLAVARDGRRFEVRTADATVDVLGTRFDVRSPIAGLGTRVAVEEGSVAVTPVAAQARVVLGAGDVAVVREAVAERRRPAEAARLTAWRDGGLAALDEPLAAVLAEVARRNGVEITLDDAARAVGPVSVFYPVAPAPATIVADLATAHGLAFTRTSRGFSVAGRPATP